MAKVTMPLVYKNDDGTLRLGMIFNDGKDDYYVYSVARRTDGYITMQLRPVNGAPAASRDSFTRAIGYAEGDR